MFVFTDNGLCDLEVLTVLLLWRGCRYGIYLSQTKLACYPHWRFKCFAFIIPFLLLPFFNYLEISMLLSKSWRITCCYHEWVRHFVFVRDAITRFSTHIASLVWLVKQIACLFLLLLDEDVRQLDCLVKGTLSYVSSGIRGDLFGGDMWAALLLWNMTLLFLNLDTMRSEFLVLGAYLPSLVLFFRFRRKLSWLSFRTLYDQAHYWFHPVVVEGDSLIKELCDVSLVYVSIQEPKEVFCREEVDHGSIRHASHSRLVLPGLLDPAHFAVVFQANHLPSSKDWHLNLNLMLLIVVESDLAWGGDLLLHKLLQLSWREVWSSL